MPKVIRISDRAWQEVKKHYEEPTDPVWKAVDRALGLDSEQDIHSAQEEEDAVQTTGKR